MKKNIILLLMMFAINHIAFTQDFAVVMQTQNASKELQGNEFRFSAFVKMEKGSEGTGHLWFRVDRTDKGTGFFENMENNPIKNSEWKKYEITGRIDTNAKTINFGCFIAGPGKIWVDDFKLEIKNNKGEWNSIDIKNPGFEDIDNNYIKDWYAKSETYLYINDSVKPYNGKYSVRVESKPEEKLISPVYVKEGAITLLPPPKTSGTVSIETALKMRRSIREYANDSITLQDVSQMLWAAYGVSDSATYKGWYLRTAPSAGACYPFEIYLVVGKVIGLKAGLYKYYPITNSLKQIIEGDIRPHLCKASLNQTFIKMAPASIVWTAVFERTTKKYKDRGRERYVCMDLGHSGENVYLQAESLNFGTCAIGAFEDDKIVKLFDLPKEEEPLYIMPFGKLTKAELEKRAGKMK